MATHGSLSPGFLTEANPQTRQLNTLSAGATAKFRLSAYFFPIRPEVVTVSISLVKQEGNSDFVNFDPSDFSLRVDVFFIFRFDTARKVSFSSEHRDLPLKTHWDYLVRSVATVTA